MYEIWHMISTQKYIVDTIENGPAKFAPHNTERLEYLVDSEIRIDTFIYMLIDSIRKAQPVLQAHSSLHYSSALPV